MIPIRESCNFGRMPKLHAPNNTSILKWQFQFLEQRCGAQHDFYKQKVRFPQNHPPMMFSILLRVDSIMLLNSIENKGVMIIL